MSYMRRRSVYGRIAQLERVHEQERRAKAYAAETADAAKRRLEWVQMIIRIGRTERQGNESLLEAMARAMQITMSELKARIQAAGAGGSFWTPEELAILTRNWTPEERAALSRKRNVESA